MRDWLLICHALVHSSRGAGLCCSIAQGGNVMGWSRGNTQTRGGSVMAGRNRKSVRRIRAGVARLVALVLLGASGGVAASASAATTGVQYKGTISLMNFGPYTLASGANVVFDTPE